MASSKTQTWAVLNDLQIPFHDKPVLKLVSAFLRDLRPYGLVLNGDIVDCYSLSEFDKNPLQKATLQTEIDQAERVMEDLAANARERWWLGGNHEDRLRRIIWRNPAFGDLEALEFPQLFHLADHGFKWKPYGGSVRLGKLHVTHGAVVRQASGATARAHFEKFGASVLHGHTHRLGTYYRTNASGGYAAYENGCLCLLTPEYVQHPDWQQGFSVVHVEPRTGLFNVQQIPILRRRTFFYGGERVGR